MRYLGGKAYSRSEAWRHLAFLIGHWHLRGYGHWAVEEKTSGKLAGRIGFLNPEGWPGFEIGWTLGRSFWGKGYAIEGARRALDYAFTQLDQAHVISLIHPQNREVRAAIIGRVLGVLCHVTGWVAPMYGAGRLESRNIREYETAARYARDCGRDDLVDCLSSFKLILSKLVVLFLVLSNFATNASSQQSLKVDRQELAAQVRAEFRHAWRGYKKYAWGHDDLRPLSKTHHDWYAQPLLMTPVDALDTMIIMGLSVEARDTREYIVKNLSFDKDIYVQNFEITIRLLGGLLSSYQLTGDRRLLILAEDLGKRLLPVFDSPTGIPYRFVNLKTGKVRGEISNPAETGTLLIEFGTLGKLTGKPVFYHRAKRALVETYNRRSPIGLIGTRINVETGKWTNTDSHISAEIDSYYEYLLKSWLLFDDQDCKRMWLASISSVNKYLAEEMDRGVNRRIGMELWYGHADMNSGKRTTTTYGALDAFLPAVLALSGDLKRARRLQDSSFKMWKLNGIEPEELNYQTMEVVHAGYPLRPEIVESTYYLYHYTKNPEYLRMGRTLFEDFVKYCRTDEGYAALKSVVTKEKSDSMQSFLFAETFKYFYLLFAPPKTLDFDRVIFNTEAHPVRKMR
jgi:mannosidase alpha-like ER degradation enhancer 2